MTDSLLPPAESSLLFGHREERQRLMEAFNSGKMPHAWLITGTQGTGKATLAFHMARYILASTSRIPSERNFEGDVVPSAHPVFRRMLQGSHSDFLLLMPDEGKKDISVEGARKLSTFYTRTPAESEWRICIIDSVDEMNDNAANAILKALEESPAQTVTFLVSHAPGRLLPTIRSRCRQLRLNPLALEDFSQLLQESASFRASAGNDYNIEELYSLTNGSPGAALSFFESEGLALREQIIDMLHSFPDLDEDKIAKLGSALDGKDALPQWRICMQLISYLLNAVVTGKQSSNRHEDQLINAMRSYRPLDYWLDLWDKTQRISSDTERAYLDRKQALFVLCHGLKNADIISNY